MNEFRLSEKAQEVWDSLQPTIDKVSNWHYDYLAFIQELAKKEIPDFSDVVVKNQGIDAYWKSQENYKIAIELKSKAMHELDSLTSGFGGKMPDDASLDEFLDRILKDMPENERRQHFKDFLIYSAEKEVDLQIEFFQLKITREECINQMCEKRFANLDDIVIQGPIQLDLEREFRSWKRLQPSDNLTITNQAKNLSKKEKMVKMLQLLKPRKPDYRRLNKKDWKEQSKNILDIPDRTFERYYHELGDHFEVSSKGGIIIKKTPPKKK